MGPFPINWILIEDNGWSKLQFGEKVMKFNIENTEGTENVWAKNEMLKSIVEQKLWMTLKAESDDQNIY